MSRRSNKSQQKMKMKMTWAEEEQEHQKMTTFVNNSYAVVEGDHELEDGFNREMRDLEIMLFKLNPMAQEFVPSTSPSPSDAHPFAFNNFQLVHAYYNPHAAAPAVFHNHPTPTPTRTKGKKKNNFHHGNGNRRMNNRTNRAQQNDVIKRTVFVSDLHHQVTEEQLAALFVDCGQVVDCRVCGDPSSVLRFAFVEFTHLEGARNASSLTGPVLGCYPIKVMPSKTAIVPVNPTYLPRSQVEREMCARTIYCTNIDKKVTQSDVKFFFESLCGEVYRLRMLGDLHYHSRIAFVEFVMAESATAAVQCWDLCQ